MIRIGVNRNEVPEAPAGTYTIEQDPTQFGACWRIIHTETGQHVSFGGAVYFFKKEAADLAYDWNNR